MKLAVPQRLAKIRNLHNLDDQYYYDDNDRLAMSGVTDMERNDALLKRFNMIKLKSEMIAMSHEIKKKAATKEEQKKETTAKKPLAAKNNLPAKQPLAFNTSLTAKKPLAVNTSVTAKNTGNTKKTLGSKRKLSDSSRISNKKSGKSRMKYTEEDKAAPLEVSEDDDEEVKNDGNADYEDFIE